MTMADKRKSMRFDLPMDEVEGKFQLLALIAAMIFPTQLSAMLSDDGALDTGAAQAFLRDRGFSQGFVATAVPGLARIQNDVPSRRAIARLREAVNTEFRGMQYEGGGACKNFQLQSLVSAAQSMEASVLAQIAFENGE
jgi:hypothetical protein